VDLADEFHRRRLDREQLLLGVVDEAIPAGLRATCRRLTDEELVVQSDVDRGDVLEVGPDDQVFRLNFVRTRPQHCLLMENLVLDRGVRLELESVIGLRDEVADETVAVQSGRI
jgi:hypothetical protein